MRSEEIQRIQWGQCSEHSHSMERFGASVSNVVSENTCTCKACNGGVQGGKCGYVKRWYMTEMYTLLGFEPDTYDSQA